MLTFFKRKKANPSAPLANGKTPPSNSLPPIDREFMNVFMQTRSRPAGDPHSAWNWVMDRIAYFKREGLARDKLYMLEGNVLLQLTDCYLANFSEFRSIVDDVTPVILTCESLSARDAELARTIAEPYVRYLLSIKDEYFGKEICCQNQQEAFILFEDFPAMAGMPRTKDNYTYLFVLYCRILDNILFQAASDMDTRKAEKRELLHIAKEISPWNSTVWEALSRTADSEEAYQDYIKKALRYSTQAGEPYGLGTIYANLALHFASKDPQLAQALCYICKKYNGNAMAAGFVLSKQSAAMPITSEAQAVSALQAAGIQTGYSDLVKRMQLAGLA